VRLFIGVWPPPDVATVLAAVPRPPHPSVRWTTPDQWHVTLRFLGEVADDALPGLVQALAPVGEVGARVARLGPSSARLGRGTLMVPVAGLDDLASAVVASSARFGRRPEDRRFTGHVTLARGRGRRPVPAELEGQPVTGAWPVEEVAVVRSRLDARGARYDTVATIRLAGAGAGPAG
jgi:2'-5' RNA ligase